MRPKLLFALKSELHGRMFSARDLARIEAFCEIINPQPPEAPDPEWLEARIEPASIVVTSWGSPRISQEVLERAPDLKLIAHAGGSVKPFVCDSVWERNIRVTSAAAAIGFGVAEYCLGLMLTASKRAHWLARSTSEGFWLEKQSDFGGWFEIYQQPVGVIGAGHVGRHLIRLLKNFACDVFVYDPYLPDDEAERLGVRLAPDLDAIFSQCRVISLNAPTTEATIGMIHGSHFAQLKPGSLFINTARAALVREDEFIAELEKGRFVACVDVTDPEPPPQNHPYRRLPNVMLTPHIAGAVAENQLRIGTFVADEIERFVQNAPPAYGVTRADLQRMA